MTESKSDKYAKTKACNKLMCGKCAIFHATKCTFAHTLDELKHPACGFGMRCKVSTCKFLHPDENMDGYRKRIGFVNPFPVSNVVFCGYNEEDKEDEEDEDNDKEDIDIMYDDDFMCEYIDGKTYISLDRTKMQKYIVYHYHKHSCEADEGLKMFSVGDSNCDIDVCGEKSDINLVYLTIAISIGRVDLGMNI